MIKVAGIESYTIAQTLELPLLFQRFFPADWSTILLVFSYAATDHSM